MCKASKPVLVQLSLAFVLSIVMIFIGCAKGEVITPTGTTTTPAGTTATPKAGTVAPKPGATFSGSIEITGKASSGTIEFNISGDGASIISVSITLKDLKTESFSAGSMTKSTSGTFPITSGNLDASLSGIGKIKGRFTSSTQASGTVDLTLDIPFSAPVKLGEWHWSAKAD
jgi:hypothetical protein